MDEENTIGPEAEVVVSATHDGTPEINGEDDIDDSKMYVLPMPGFCSRATLAVSVV